MSGAGSHGVSRRTLLKGAGAGTAGLLAGTNLLTRPAADAAHRRDDDGTTSRFGPLYSGVHARAAVVVQFDDGDERDHSFAFPLLKARGLAGAVSLVSRNLGGGENLTVAQAHELQANGWEILCHSRTHEDNLSTASKAFRVFSSETAGAKEDLETLGFNVQSFQQPGSWKGRYYIDRAEKLDSRAGRLLKETFAAVFAFVPYDLWNHLRPVPVLERYGGALAGGDTMTLDTLRGVVDNAVKYGA
ncbi:MAG TPA: polysaccharide deacetylase family protein, partial [Actinomycetota bacterium]|nr:polysaccharide deacetylase family protein [Actinomycetota bacterium]